MVDGRPTVGSLFAGVGGFDLAFHREGFRVAWAVEIDPKCRMVLRRQFPDTRLYEDVTQVEPAELEPVDVVTFGSPCQDLSVAGKRAGLAGERSGLFHDAIRIVRGLRPAVAVYENVPGALSSNRGHDWASVLREMAEGGDREVAYRLLDSRYFGVAQRRRRVFAVGCLGAGRAEQILALAEGMSGHPAPGGASREGSPSGAAIGAGGNCWPSVAMPVMARDAKGLRNFFDGGLQGAVVFPSCDPAKSLQTLQRGIDREDMHTLVAVLSDPTHSLTSEGHDASEDGTGRGTPIVAVCFDAYNQTLSGDVANSVTSASGSSNATGPKVIFQESQSGLREYDTAGCLRASGPGHDPVGSRVRHGSIVRRLTPTECERLQGFPDGWTAAGVDESGTTVQMADSPRYRMMGNAVTVNVAQWIARNVLEAIR